MKRIMVRYTVRPGLAEENERFITAVFDALAADQPPKLRYAVFKLDDGLSFVHHVSYEGDDTTTLRALPAFQAFLAGVGARCEQPPVSTTLHEVGSYRLNGP